MGSFGPVQAKISVAEGTLAYAACTDSTAVMIQVRGRAGWGGRGRGCCMPPGRVVTCHGLLSHWARSLHCC